MFFLLFFDILKVDAILMAKSRPERIHMDKVIIFDTTLRDGEQAAGGTLTIWLTAQLPTSAGIKGPEQTPKEVSIALVPVVLTIHTCASPPTVRFA
jgi:hypothetical protein